MNEFKRVFTTPPLDWRKQRLGEFLERVDTRNVVGDQNVLTISAEHGLISQGEFFNRRVASENVAGYYRLVNGDFAYNKSYSRGYPMGAIRRLDRYPSGVVSPLYICFRLSVGAPVDSDFLAHYFDGGAIDTQLADVAKEGARNHGLLNVSVKEFFEIETALPPIEEQRCVAQILDTLDTTIRETEALIDKLKAVKQGLLHDLLTRGIDANGELRPPQSEAPQLYKESPLGWIPREWTGARLADVCDPNRPITYGVLKPGDYKENGIPLLQIQDVIHGSINFGNVHRISDQLDLAYSRTMVYGGEIVMSLVGTIGKVAQIPYECERSNLHRNLGLIAIQKSEIPEFFLWFLMSERFAGQVLSETFGSTQALLNLNSVRGFSVPLPPVGERKQIAELMNGSELQIKQEIVKLKKLERTKTGLMADLLTGRVRVTPLLEPVQQPAAQTGG